jgi:hypothetical protein
MSSIVNCDVALSHIGCSPRSTRSWNHWARSVVFPDPAGADTTVTPRGGGNGQPTMAFLLDGSWLFDGLVWQTAVAELEVTSIGLLVSAVSGPLPGDSVAAERRCQQGGHPASPVMVQQRGSWSD